MFLKSATADAHAKVLGEHETSAFLLVCHKSVMRLITAL